MEEMNSTNTANNQPKKSWPAPHRTLTFWLIILIIVIIMGGIHQKRLQNSKAPRVQALPVVLDTAKNKTIPIYISALGGVNPLYTVTVKTQINGQLLRVLFQEGQMVKKGDLLAEIDPRPYLAQLTQYEGQLLRDKALLANALIDLKRYEKLWKQDSVSQQTLATQQSLVQQYQGAVKSDEGLLQSTRVNLQYCQITSPVDGRIGLRLVDPGNFVQTSDTTGLAVITTLDPINVIFTIPEDNVPQVLSKINTNQTMLVKAYDRQKNKMLAKGKLLTIDNQIDTTTGTVKLKATFENKTNALFPNQFVNIKLLIDVLKEATVIPTAAIQYSPNGHFVYVYNQNQTVSAKAIKTGVVSGEDTVITDGVTSGESVVIEGADKLSDGASVKVAQASQPAAKPQQQIARNRSSRWRLFS